MKKRVFPLFLFLLSLSVSALPHNPSTPYGWYCPRCREGESVPAKDASFSFMDGKKAIWFDENADENDKVIYLTFDAGYENGNVAKILDVLHKHAAPGTFFILSHLAEKETPLVQRMLDEGHLVCNHTSSHCDMSRKTDRESFLGELKELDDAMEKAVGVPAAKFYRPPEGRFSENNLVWAEEAGYTTVFWSFAYADWDNDRQPDPGEAKEKILSHAMNGSVFLLHPTSATNAAVLDEVMTVLEREGFRFGRIDEIETD